MKNVYLVRSKCSTLKRGHEFSVAELQDELAFLKSLLPVSDDKVEVVTLSRRKAESFKEQCVKAYTFSFWDNKSEAESLGVRADYFAFVHYYYIEKRILL